MQSYFNGRVKVKTGDITRENTDAIVNAANSSLMGGGGVDGAIHRAGGDSILDDCRNIRNKQYPNGLPTGEAVVTCSGNMPSKMVIHTVGPIWHGGNNNEDQLLAAAYRNSLKLAKARGATSIAFPAISTGVYGFPKVRAAKIVSDILKDWVKTDDTITKIVMVFFSEKDAEIFTRAIENIES